MNEALKERLIQAVGSIDAGAVAKVYGRLVRINGLTLEVTGCQLSIGQRCFIETLNNGSLAAEVVGFNRDISYLMPLQHAVGLFSGARVSPQSGIENIVGVSLLWVCSLSNISS